MAATVDTPPQAVDGHEIERTLVSLDLLHERILGRAQDNLDVVRNLCGDELIPGWVVLHRDNPSDALSVPDRRASRPVLEHPQIGTYSLFQQIDCRVRVPGDRPPVPIDSAPCPIAPAPTRVPKA